jgi:hypothetical protein
LGGSWIGALQFLQDLEIQEQWLFVDSLIIRSSEQEGVVAVNEPQVQMSLAISGLVAQDLLASKP